MITDDLRPNNFRVAIERCVAGLNTLITGRWNPDEFINIKNMSDERIANTVLDKVNDADSLIRTYRRVNKDLVDENKALRAELEPLQLKIEQLKSDNEALRAALKSK